MQYHILNLQCENTGNQVVLGRFIATFMQDVLVLHTFHSSGDQRLGSTAFTPYLAVKLVLRRIRPFCRRLKERGQWVARVPEQSHGGTHSVRTNGNTRKRRAQQVWSVLQQSLKDLLQDSGPEWAAAIAYYSLLSIFPLLLATVTISSFFVSVDTAVANTTIVFGRFVPQGSEQIEQIVRETYATRGGLSVFSFVVLLWSGSRVFGVITKAINIAYDVDETYGFLKRALIELVMLVSIGVIFLAALALPLILDILNILSFSRRSVAVLVSVLHVIGPTLLLFGAFLLTYRFVPRGRRHWGSAAIGAAVAALLVTAARPVFFSYVQQIGQYNLIYGSLAILVILVLWAWVVALLMLFGGEVASHVQTMIIEGRSAEDVDRRHRARSPTDPYTQ